MNLLADLTVDDIPEPTDDGGSTETETETPEGTEPEPSAVGPTGDPEQPKAPAEIEPLSDEDLAKLDPAIREQLVKRLDLAREAKRTHDRAFLKLKAREDKFKGRRAQFEQNQQAFNNHTALIRANLDVLRTGDGKAVIQALQQLTGRDAHSIVEEMNLSLVGKRKPDDAVVQLQKRIDAMAKEREAEREEARRGQELSRMERAAEQAKERLVTNARQPTYPLLSQYTADNADEVKEALAHIVTERYHAGNPVSDHEACQILEAHLTKLSRVQAPAQKPVVGAAANGSRSQGTPASRAPAQSLTSHQVSSGSSQREKSQREILEELADDPEVDRFFGGFLS
jgi:hypothetical protein